MVQIVYDHHFIDEAQTQATDEEDSAAERAAAGEGWEGSAAGPEEAREVADCGGAAGVDPGDPGGDAQHVGRRVMVERPAQDERRPVEQHDLDGRAGETGDGGHDGARGRAVEGGPAGCGSGGEDGMQLNGAAALGKEKSREVVLEGKEGYAIEDGRCSRRPRGGRHGKYLVEEGVGET